VVVFWVLLNGIRSRRPRWFLFYTLVALGLVGVVLCCYQRFVAPDWRVIGAGRGQQLMGRASGSFSIPNSYAGFLLLILPAVVALTLRRAASATERVWWGWVGLVLLLGFVLTLSRGAWLALALALPVLPLLGAQGGGRRRAILAVAVAVVLLACGYGIITQYRPAQERFRQLVADNGEVTRPAMWRGAWDLFRASPLLGSGAGSYNVLFERHRREGFRDEPLWAHNEYLNTLSDYGAVGFVLGFGAVAVIGVGCLRNGSADRRRVSRLDDPFVVAGFGAGLFAFALQMGLDFHWKIPALALASATMAGLTVSAVWPQTDRPRESNPGWSPLLLVLAAGVAVGGGWWFLPKLEAEGLRSDARRSIDLLWRLSPAQPEYLRIVRDSHDALSRATRIDPANAQAWSDFAYALALRIRAEAPHRVELGRAAEAAASRAIALSAVCGEFWIRRGIAKDAQGRWEEAGRDFENAVKLSPADSLTWYHWAEHLSRLPAAHEAAEAALDFCLRLDPGNQAGLALRQRLAIKK
jgi:O-antigen ligase